MRHKRRHNTRTSVLILSQYYIIATHIAILLTNSKMTKILFTNYTNLSKLGRSGKLGSFISIVLTFYR